jgi:hypothetical protein
MAKKTPRIPPKVQLIVSDDQNPAVELQPGMRFEVESVPLVDPTFRQAPAVGARLCGGTSTCLALVQIDPAER